MTKFWREMLYHRKPSPGQSLVPANKIASFRPSSSELLFFLGIWKPSTVTFKTEDRYRLTYCELICYTLNITYHSSVHLNLWERPNACMFNNKIIYVQTIFSTVTSLVIVYFFYVYFINVHFMKNSYCALKHSLW